MKTAKEMILQRLALADDTLAIHEFDIPSVSQTSISARLREMRRAGLVESIPVEGKFFTKWRLTTQSDYLFEVK